MSIVLILEKPFMARDLAPQIAAQWPGLPVFCIYMGLSGPHEFRYPRGLSMIDYPFVSEPAWKPLTPGLRVFQFHGTEVRQVDMGLGQVLSEATNIVFANSLDPSGAVAFQVLIEQNLGCQQALDARPVLNFDAYPHHNLQLAWHNQSTTHDATFIDLVNAGRARRFFDFNFNVNSLAILGSALRAAGAEPDAPPISKYSLQLLYRLKATPPMSEDDLIFDMQDWQGTGRYKAMKLGSPASRGRIIQNLTAAGLMIQDKEHQVRLSHRGALFLSALHPGCEDLDLPARLIQWENTWPASKPKVEKYLRTFFGRQRRFLGSEIPAPR